MKNQSDNLNVFNSARLVEKLKLGSAVLFPTDTLPALGAYPKFSSKLWEIKQRPIDKPLILMGAQPEALFEFVLPCALNDAKEMASIYWPGALTMALPIGRSSVNLLNPFSDKVGMRVPDFEIARNFLFQSGPLATTSANLSGIEPSIKAEQTSNVFPDLPILGPVPWPNGSGLASTVIIWEKSGCWRLLRKGAVNPSVGFIN